MEEGTLQYNLGLNLQYYFNKAVGVQLEYGYQRGNYSGPLKWYGRWIRDPTGGLGEYLYFPINHLEDPYTEPWAVHSVIVSLVLKYPRRRRKDRLTPYVTLGYGYHFLSTDRKKVLERWRLGPQASETTFKLGVGIKYRLTNMLNLTARIIGQTLNRKHGQNIAYAGAMGGGLSVDPRDQFDFNYYADTGQIMRSYDALANTITFIGLEVGLEFILGKK